MTRKYEEEQGEIAKRAKILRAELKKETSRLYTTDTFLKIARQYTDAKEVTQRVVPHYHCIGAFEVPD